MPDGDKRKQRNNSVKDTTNLATPSKYKMTYMKKRNKESKASEARARHDLNMRSTGRKELATNYGTKKGD